jgi:electron transfer flavoprotein beta subunit
MKMLVCVKYVQESEAGIRIDDSGQRTLIDRSTSFRMNRYDEFAVEEALLIREAFPETIIDVISVGSAPDAWVIRRAMGMGANHGIHILTEDQGYLSPFLTASWIADCARPKNYDLILTGAMSEDLMHGQVGPMLAELLSLPCATSVIYEHLSSEGTTIYVEREIEGGFRHCMELDLPTVLAVQSGINKPRYPSLSNMLRAKKQKLETVRVDSLEQLEPLERLVRFTYPQKTRNGVFLDGTQQEKAAKLLEILSERSLIH